MVFAIMLNCGNLILKFAPPSHQCPTGQVGTYPYCSTPPKPVATCSSRRKREWRYIPIYTMPAQLSRATIQNTPIAYTEKYSSKNEGNSNNRIATYTEKRQDHTK